MNLVDENSVCMTQVRCDFITGSNAQGCMVVVVVGSEQSNQTMEFNLTRQMNTSSASADIGNIDNEMVIIIFAYDIEEDGSIGQVAVPGSVNISNVDKYLGSCSSRNKLSKLMEKDDSLTYDLWSCCASFYSNNATNNHWNYHNAHYLDCHNFYIHCSGHLQI